MQKKTLKCLLKYAKLFNFNAIRCEEIQSTMQLFQDINSVGNANKIAPKATGLWSESVSNR